jgi:hypothetical protein
MQVDKNLNRVGISWQLTVWRELYYLFIFTGMLRLAFRPSLAPPVMTAIEFGVRSTRTGLINDG